LVALILNSVNATVRIDLSADLINLANEQIELFGDQSASSASVDGLVIDSKSTAVTTADPVIRDQTEYAVLDLSGENGDTLISSAGSGAEIELVITTGDGSQTTEVISVPNPVDNTQTTTGL
jgi:hypothetical protein